MMMLKSILLLFLLSTIFIEVVGQNDIKPEPRHYNCIKISNAPIIDGDINDDVWKLAPWTINFNDISGADFSKPTYDTRIKLLWDDSTLYIAAYLQEPHLWATITENESIIFYDNDFEVFIDPDGDNHNYFELEFNAFNTIWDLFLQRPYRDVVKADNSWNCKSLKSAVKLYGSINNPQGEKDSAWTIEIAIPFSSLSHYISDDSLEYYSTVLPKVGAQWRMNFSRVQWDITHNNKEYIKLDKPEHNWVWSPQWEINMHMPEYWGYIDFIDENTDTNKFSSDKYWDIKTSLMNFHKYQRKYFKKFKEIDTLRHNTNEFNKLLKVEFLSNEIFYASISTDILTFYVNEKGRLWSVSNDRKLPVFWTWMHNKANYSLKQWDLLFAELHSIGIHGVLLGASPEKIREILPIAKVYGIQLDAWIWIMNRADAPDSLMSINALGESLASDIAYVDYYKFMSPALTGTKDFIKKTLKPYQEIQGLTAIHFDYIRYVDVVLPIGLQPKYNLVQDHIMLEYDYGYHPQMIREFEKSVGKKYSNNQELALDSNFVKFRMDKVTEIVNALVIDNLKYGKRTSAAVFPDVEMAQQMVRQDWGQWNIDYCFPMLYHQFYNEDISWIQHEMEINRAALLNKTIIAGLYLPSLKNPEELKSAINFAFKGGADGVAFFDIRAMTTSQKKALKELISNRRFLGL